MILYNGVWLYLGATTFSEISPFAWVRSNSCGQDNKYLAKNRICWSSPIYEANILCVLLFFVEILLKCNTWTHFSSFLNANVIRLHDKKNHVWIKEMFILYYKRNENDIDALVLILNLSFYTLEYSIYKSTYAVRAQKLRFLFFLWKTRSIWWLSMP